MNEPSERFARADFDRHVRRRAANREPIRQLLDEPDARGKLTFDTDNHEGGASEDVLTRNIIKPPPGRYRLNAKVTLRRLKDGELP